MKKFLMAVLCCGLLAVFGSGTAQAAAKMITKGSKVSFDYSLTVDGKEIETSQGRAPLSYVQGEGQIIPGLAKALEGMKVGERKTVTVAPAEAYGVVNPQAFQEIPKSSLPQTVQPKPGLMLVMMAPNGQGTPVKIKEVKKDSVVLDLNHPLAGKTLVFRVKIVSIQ